MGESGLAGVGRPDKGVSPVLGVETEMAKGEYGRIQGDSPNRLDGHSIFAIHPDLVYNMGRWE
jgi:hypothetical protein